MSSHNQCKSNLPWQNIAEDLAFSLADFNHHWKAETRSEMHRWSHNAMIAYCEAAGLDWRKWRDDQHLKVCECHP